MKLSLTKTTFFILAIFSLSSCTGDLKQAEKSLVGNWEVYEIQSQYGDFVIQNGVVTSVVETENKTDKGNLGTFVFNENRLKFDFKRDESRSRGEAPWNLNLSLANSGFFKVNKWTLSLGEKYSFITQFGNSTKNAEKNATHIQLKSWPKTSGEGVAYFMKLKKN